MAHPPHSRPSPVRDRPVRDRPVRDWPVRDRIRGRFGPRAALPAALIALAACGSHLNEGYVRAAMTGPDGLVSGAAYLDAGQDARGGSLAAGDLFQIRLDSAYICNFREGGGGADALAGSNRGARACRDEATGGLSLTGRATRGEIALTAGVTLPGTAAGEERVIFYSGDVRETGQMLNFLNIPVYGPARYRPGDMALTLRVLELDEEEAAAQGAVLSALAGLGAEMAAPAFGSAFGALGRIGEAVVAANRDDVELAFRIGFEPPGPAGEPAGGLAMPRLTLREGYLVVMRRERRDDHGHFDGLVVCPARGYVARSRADCAANRPYDGATWLLLRVVRVSEDTVRAALRGAMRGALDRSALPGASAQDILGLLGVDD